MTHSHYMQHLQLPNEHMYRSQLRFLDNGSKQIR